ncbi:AraC family transcriptional regulator [Parvularcula sp. ZS-1/3]|uniref:AraC family transcriptional regulator n=1 Tax=Parvularcula mediterranea TaxID=2732508 RepID=A0A7Y3RP13_9PROT|nr:helix-turn-helix domain-containing protein [Parvularcula mediterranea]NNU17627.1 AraC family transcriptional regulator [Parvularcula mediterranea]
MPEASPTVGFLAGIAFGSIALVALTLLRSGASRGTMIAGLIFCVATAIVVTEDLTESYAYHLAGFAAAVMTGALWAFALQLFGFRTSPQRLWTPMAVLLAVNAAAHVIPEVHDPALLVQRTLIAVFGIGVLILVLRSEADDLDPVRRRIRRPFVALIGLWTALAPTLGTLSGLGLLPRELILLDEIGNAVMCFLGALLFTVPQRALFAPPEKEKPRPAQPEGDDAQLLAKLDNAMTHEKAWLEEGLTVGGLAEKLGVPEHRLRPVINQQLGHRNFAAFINRHRLEEAKRRLSSPDHKGETVASIAYAVGFGSLGPFGRAFKDATGMTPTAYRKANSQSPMSES